MTKELINDSLVLDALNAHDPDAATPHISDWGEELAARMRRVIEVVLDKASANRAPAQVGSSDDREAKAEALASRAAVPDAATGERITELEGELDKRRRLSDKHMEHAHEAGQRAQAALAAVERVRAFHLPVALETKTVCNSCDEEWPCDTREVLDGAPEPEVKR